MKSIVKTNNKQVAIEVISAQNLFDVNFKEITIESIGSAKYCLNNYDAQVKINNFEFILYRDLNFKNVDIKALLTTNLDNIEFSDL